jgi:hypothetical protein
MPDDMRRLEHDLAALLGREEMAEANASANVMFQSTKETP